MSGFVGVINDAISPPAGVQLQSEKDHLIWDQFTRERAKDFWRDMDHVLWLKSYGWKLILAQLKRS